MKKLLFFFFTTLLSNISYASFPVFNKTTIKQETYQTKVIKNSLKQPINKQKNILKFFLFSALIGLIMTFYGILSSSKNDIGIGLFGGAIFIASILVIVINFLFKRIIKKQ